MSNKTKSRHRSKHVIITNEGGQPIDKKTKQLLFHECTIFPIRQTFLKDYESFTEQKANQLLEKYIKRRRSKCTAYFLIDRIRIEKKSGLTNPFRKDVTYREMKHFFVFPNHPEEFMICVVNEVNGKRSYESFGCNSIEDVNSICDLTYRASIDKQNILRDLTPLRLVSIFPDPNDELFMNTDQLGSRPQPKQDQSNHTSTVGRRMQYSPNDRKDITKQANHINNFYSQKDHLTETYSKSNYNSVIPFDFRAQNQKSTNDLSNSNQNSVDAHVSKAITIHKDMEEPVTHTVLKSNAHFISPVQDRQSKYRDPNFNNVKNPGLKKTQSLTILYGPENVSPNFSLQDESEPQSIRTVQPFQYELHPSYPNGDSRTSSYQTTQEEPKLERKIIIERSPQMESNNLRNQELRKAGSHLDVRHGNEVTYINSNPTSGAYVNENGPVYMFVIR